MCLSTEGLNNHPPIPVSDFVPYVIQLKQNDAILFSAEYESIDPGGGTGSGGPHGVPVAGQSSSCGTPLTWDASIADVNRLKNRYANVVAYDHSRVRLRSVGGATDVDNYINANYIDGFCRPRAYIATQVSESVCRDR